MCSLHFFVPIFAPIFFMEFDQSIECTVKLVLVAPYTCTQGPDVISSSGQWAVLLLVHYGYWWWPR